MTNLRSFLRREYEILMRKVMALEHQPAVMALYWWSPWHHRFFQSSQDEMDVIARCRRCSSMYFATEPPVQRPRISCDRASSSDQRDRILAEAYRGLTFASNSLENILFLCICSCCLVCRYYGVPSLSWRDAAYHLMATNASGFTFDEVYLDHGHPNGACGHR